LQPYFKINPTQLSDWEITGTMAVKYQQINGIKFEDKLRVVFIFHSLKPGRAIISSNFQQGLDFATTHFITQEKADEVNRLQTGRTSSDFVKSELLICPIYKTGSDVIDYYRPCWRIITMLSNRDHIYYIDAIDGTPLMDKEATQINNIKSR